MKAREQKLDALKISVEDLAELIRKIGCKVGCESSVQIDGTLKRLEREFREADNVRGSDEAV